MKIRSLLLITCFINAFFFFDAVGQVSINKNGNAPDNSAMLDVVSDDRGFLLPRMTQEQIGEISNPANGLVVFCSSDDKFYVYIATTGKWNEISYGSGSITPTFCGSPITIEHEAGNVAPVTKTVTYGTVTNIPGEPSKCWLTRNLGAGQQANAVDDDTEPSAGWYWQFNRKQGYKHDETNRTPNTPWEHPVSENSDWIAANDPCALLLGSTWRIPTSSELSNVFASGNWTDWTGPWGSSLKMHAAGQLDGGSGVLGFRGVGGYYWSSLQSNNESSWSLYFGSTGCGIYASDKMAGFTIRCLKEL